MEVLMETEILTPDEVCEMLKIKKSYIYYLTHNGNIPFFKVGRHLRFYKEEILNWLNSKKNNNGGDENDIV
jgi:excisionase family DNA binding protein